MIIAVYEARGPMAKTDLGKALKDRSGKTGLRQHLRNLLNRKVGPTNYNTPNIQFFEDKYGEQITHDAVQDIAKFFESNRHRGFTPGGIPTPYPPLAILPRDIKPSNTAIATIGEALAGWYLEQLNMTCLSRPISEGADLVFRDAHGTITLISSVKATQGPDIEGRLCEAAIDLLEYVGNVVLMDPVSPFDCSVIGVVIRPQSNYDLHSLRIEVR